MSVIHLERAGMPRLVILSLVVTLALLGALGYVLCRSHIEKKSKTLDQGSLLIPKIEFFRPGPSFIKNYIDHTYK